MAYQASQSSEPLPLKEQPSEDELEYPDWGKVMGLYGAMLDSAQRIIERGRR